MHFCLLSGTSSNSIISSASLSILSSRAHPPCYYLLAVRFIKHSHTHLITYIFTYSNRTLYRSHSTKTGHFSHHKTNVHINQPLSLTLRHTDPHDQISLCSVITLQFTQGLFSAFCSISPTLKLPPALSQSSMSAAVLHLLLSYISLFISYSCLLSFTSHRNCGNMKTETVTLGQLLACFLWSVGTLLCCDRWSSMSLNLLRSGLFESLELT